MRTKHFLIIAAMFTAAATASAQLRPDEVLVVYDSRIPDSRAVAEFYAGSAKVPGGVGGLAAARPGVRVFNLAASGAPVTSAYLPFSDFAPKLRDPIRAFLLARHLEQKVRCLVMTKGLPHRIDDSDSTNIGDNPAGFIDEFNSGDVTCASVDSELTLLWQDLTTGENGGTADSKADGMVINPYWRLSVPLNSFTTANIRTQKVFSSSPGPVYAPFGSGPSRLTPGDMYLVTRLDGRTLDDVRACITRGKAILYNVDADHLLFDEADSNGINDGGANSELDNQGALASLRAGDDYEKSRDYLLNTDKRFAPGVVDYDALGGADHFFIGPRLNPQGGIPITGNIALLATYGSNHGAFFPTTPSGQSLGALFAQTFNYANGAIFNTIESYNGRDFGGAGIGFIVQEQASDFIASGGTLAIGHVWEPLADTIADNEFLVKNFLEGDLSWAEAAWSSVPVLSWMHVVIGDPLARPARTSEDINADARVSVADLYAYEVLPRDIDRSGSATAADRALVVRSLRFNERGDLVAGRP